MLVDGAQVGTVTPVSTSYALYQTPNFTVTAGTHTIQFVGLNPLGGDNTAFIDEVAIAPQANSISDGSFEVPGLAANTYQYAPNGSPWQFSGGGRGEQQRQRLHRRQSQCARRHPGRLPPRHRQHEPIRLPGRRHLQPLVPGRPAGRHSQTHFQEIEVLVDSAEVGMVTPTGTSYASYQTPSFTVTAGMHTIAFVGLNPQSGDNTAFIDEVQF